MTSDEQAGDGSIAMSSDEISDFLGESGHGVLSLAREDDAYSVPISFGYDGERLFLSLIQFGDDSEKLEYIESDGQASLTVYDVETRFDWWSITVRGSLHEVSDDERAYVEETMDENAWHPSLFPPTDAMTGVTWMELDIAEMTGRKGEEYQ